MNEFKIETGIPIPSRGKGFTHAFKQMAIGDSVFIPTKKTNVHNMANQVNIKITSRAEGDGRRVWRIA